MLKKISILISILTISSLLLGGCKKRSTKAEAEQETVKTMDEHQADAKEQINKENMASELESIEKAMEQEISQEQ